MTLRSQTCVVVLMMISMLLMHFGNDGSLGWPLLGRTNIAWLWGLAPARAWRPLTLQAAAHQGAQIESAATTMWHHQGETPCSCFGAPTTSLSVQEVSG